MLPYIVDLPSETMELYRTGYLRSSFEKIVLINKMFVVQL